MTVKTLVSQRVRALGMRENGDASLTAARPDPLSEVLEHSGGLAADHRIGVAVMAILSHLPASASRTLAVCRG